MCRSRPAQRTRGASSQCVLADRRHLLGSREIALARKRGGVRLASMVRTHPICGMYRSLNSRSAEVTMGTHNQGLNMKKLTVGLLTGLVSMMTLVSAAGAQPPEAPIPPPMSEIVTDSGCFDAEETKTDPNNKGKCRRGSAWLVTTTVFNPAGHAPKGLNK